MHEYSYFFEFVTQRETIAYFNVQSELVAQLVLERCLRASVTLNLPCFIPTKAIKSLSENSSTLSVHSLILCNSSLYRP